MKTRFPVLIFCRDLKALKSLQEVYSSFASYHRLGVQWSILGEILQGKPLFLCDQYSKQFHKQSECDGMKAMSDATISCTLVLGSETFISDRVRPAAGKRVDWVCTLSAPRDLRLSAQKLFSHSCYVLNGADFRNPQAAKVSSYR